MISPRTPRIAGAARAWGLSLSILASACAGPPIPSSANVPPADSTSVAAAPAPADPESISPLPPQPAESAIPAPPRPPAPRAPRDHDCDPGGPEPQVCVLPGETSGAVVGPSGCREAPRAAICRACRPVFKKVEAGRCCYVGLSRFPRCKD